MGEKQRIYIGGLDPNRGLTVELVASRLQSVKGVEIDMISDGNNPKHTLIDEDGDLVDTRNFFYIEARATDEESQSSALDLLAKQYHNTKWKGCLLRVEEAKPHFLKRLEQEREERQERAAAAAAALAVGTEESQAKDNVAEEGTKEVKQRRRLRIKQRFGEEAFHVDTHPRQIQLGNGSSEGWADFAFLRNRMIEKRESQRKNLMERRKQERRSWAGGISNKEVAPSESDLRSLIFLNRGIHIRFGSLEATDLTSNGSLKDVIEDDESSSCPSSSDSDESSIRAEDNHQKSYVWSDDDDDDEVDDIGANVLEDENHLSSESEEDADRNAKSDSDDDSIDIKRRLVNTTKGRNLKGDAEYTKAVVADEFSFGADFDFTLNNHDDTESVRSDNANTFNESLDIKLEDDISSNINILSKLFPRDNFDSKPLAESINKIDNSNGEENSREKQKFGAGLIMQRYDPTKDADKIFEKVDTKAIKANEEVEEKPDEGQSEEQPVPDDASLSSESSESLSADEIEEQEEKEEAQTALNTEVLPSTDAVTEESRDVYEQDKLEDVFKQSRQAASTTSAVGGFSFGFQVPSANPPSNSFSFGFSISDEPKVEENTSIDGPLTKKLDEVDDVDKKRQKSARETRRVRRVGLTIPERDLDAYEDLFFGLNEGHQILKDLEAMKQDEDSQNLWQTERAQLTSDWKRKQKAAQSRRVKKIRR
jgi:hypothetical protein